MRTRANRFSAGSGCFTCRLCQYRTRDTGGDNTDLHLCTECFELAGYDNMESDGVELSDQDKREMQRLQQIVQGRKRP